METAKHIESPEADKSPFTQSKQSNIALWSYVEVNGTHTVPDETVRDFFERMKMEGTHKIVFYDGRIRTADEFLLMLKSKRVVPTFGLLDQRIVGVGWLNNIVGNHAEVHFGFLKVALGTVAMTLTKWAIDQWFSITDASGAPWIDVLVGMIPVSNVKALRFAEKVGFECVGQIPLVAQNV